MEIITASVNEKRSTKSSFNSMDEENSNKKSSLTNSYEKSPNTYETPELNVNNEYSQLKRVILGIGTEQG